MNRKLIVVGIGVALLVLAIPTYGFVHAQDEMELPSLWTFDLNSTSISGAAAGDIDGDGNIEVVFGTHLGDGHLYALNGENGSLLWSILAGGGPVESAVRIHDINNDSQDDVVFCAYDSYIEGTGILYALNGSDGSILWEYHFDAYSKGGPAIADMDEDSKLEILFGGTRNSTGGYIYILNAEDGSLQQTIGPFDGDILSSPVVLDLNLDGHLDLAFSTHDGDNSVHAVDGTDFSPMWRYSAGADLTQGCAFADIDRDSIQELVIASANGRIHAINGEDGSRLWSYAGSYPYYAVSLAYDELLHEYNVISIAQQSVLVLGGNGEPSWSVSYAGTGPPPYFYAHTSPCISDLDGDDIMDVLTSNSAGRFEARDCRYGGIRTLFNVTDQSPNGPVGIYHSPITADFNGDGYLDTFFVGGKWDSVNPIDNYGIAFAFKGTNGTGDGWSMDRHNIRNSGYVEGYSSTVLVSIHVEDFYNGSSIEGATVGTSDFMFSKSTLGLTDEFGNLFLNLYPGFTTLVVSAEGYNADYQSVRILIEDDQYFEFRLNEDLPETTTVPITGFPNIIPDQMTELVGLAVSVGIIAILIVMAVLWRRL
ncbi:MAG: FG-GAP-like repeat-containing protein [Candidatus Thorarchaeota archaeon]|jgi:outer membrane protein assembly factor BamB